MSLPPLATIEDIAARQPGGVPDADETRVTALLTDASALVRAVAGIDWLDDTGQLTPVPDIIVAIVCASARRAYNNPEGAVSESDGSWSQTNASKAGDPYLEPYEEKRIRQAAGRNELWALPITRDPEHVGLETSRRRPWVSGEYLPTDPPGGDQIVWGGQV
jgi:hypothetical protein